MKNVLAVALLAAASLAHAESTPAKKELVAKVLQLQQPAIELVARQLAERPAAIMMQQAGPALQFRVPPEKREALVKDIQSDIKKYADESVPLLRERAVKLAPSTMGIILEDKFSEDELKQLIVFLESPVQRKYAQIGQEIQKSLAEKLVSDTRGIIEPKVKALEQSITKRVNDAISAESGAKPAAKPAAK